MSHYSVKPAETEALYGPPNPNVNIQLNHVTNSVSRHYNDIVKISLVRMDDGTDIQ
jgi:hypothetical protein